MNLKMFYLWWFIIKKHHLSNGTFKNPEELLLINCSDEDGNRIDCFLFLKKKINY